jgi:hypothetical protein
MVGTPYHRQHDAVSDSGGWLADNDYGEMFLNFPLHPDLRKYCGIDLSQLFPELIEDGKDSVIAQWMRNAMGL